jgi:hypothetical protein
MYLIKSVLGDQQLSRTVVPDTDDCSGILNLGNYVYVLKELSYGAKLRRAAFFSPVALLKFTPSHLRPKHPFPHPLSRMQIALLVYYAYITLNDPYRGVTSALDLSLSHLEANEIGAEARLQRRRTWTEQLILA